MSDENDRRVAGKLGRIEALLEANATNLDRLETRLFGVNDDPEGGLMGAHDRRIKRLETWVIRVVSAVVVFNFMTGNGPATLGGIVRMFSK